MDNINFKHITKCPVCGEELVVIDNYNYMTMLCPDCHSTIFEEFNHVVHTIKYGIMEDNYDASMDIVYKQFITYSLYARTLSQSKYEVFWTEKKMIGMLENEDIFASGIFDHYANRIKSFKMMQPCIYFKGYEKYLEMSKPEADKFKRDYIDTRRN